MLISQIDGKLRERERETMDEWTDRWIIRSTENGGRMDEWMDG